jgi:two-component system sensor histidine kinase CpxA
VDNIYLRDAKGQMQSSTRLSKFVIRFMLDSDNPAKPMLGSEHQRHRRPLPDVHHGQTYHVYFGLNVENSYLFLFIQILDHPIQILGIAMLVSTPLCLLLAWRLTRPILQLQQSVSQLAQGNLEIQIPNLGRRDEIGQLAEHVSRMVDTLKNMIQKQKQLLSDISHELRSPSPASSWRRR